jgi:hypothetical protein
MPLPIDEDPEYVSDIETGRRVELQLANDCLLALQYFPEFDNIAVSFYTKNMPGFTIGLPTAEWSRVQELVRDFTWRKQ